MSGTPRFAAAPAGLLPLTAGLLPLPAGLLPLAAALGAWQLFGSPESRSAPPPGHWVVAIARLYTEGRLVAALGNTLTTFVLALVAAGVIGSAIGVALGLSARIDQAVSPSLDLLASLPGAAVAPLVTLALGAGRAAGVVVVALAVVWPILHNSTAAARAIPGIRLESARTLRLTGPHRWRSVILPSVAPGVLVGIRVAASMALIVTLLADILGTGDGVGRLLVERQQRFDAAGAWGLLFIVGVLGYLISLAVELMDRAYLRLSGAPGPDSGQAACPPPASERTP